jgi:hypothetical protein
LLVLLQAMIEPTPTNTSAPKEALIQVAMSFSQPPDPIGGPKPIITRKCT